MENQNQNSEILQLKDIYPRIKGKVNTKDEALMAINVFRLTINYISIYRTAKNNPVPLYSGAIYCYIEGIGDHKRWRDTGKWLCSIPRGPFLDYEQKEGTLIKRTFSKKLDKYKYHIINYYDKNDTSLETLSNHFYIKSLKQSIQENSFLLNDNILNAMHLGVSYFYAKEGVNISNLAKIRGEGDPLKLYAKRIETFIVHFRILKIASFTKKLCEHEKELVFTLMFELPFDNKGNIKRSD